MKRGKTFYFGFGIVAMILMGMFLSAGLSKNAAAEPSEVYGQRAGSDVRAIINVNGDSTMSRIVYFKLVSHATGGANTPVASDTYCGVAGNFHWAKVAFTGTLGGAAPTLVVKWQNSKDHGTTWSDVGTWTTINATVTPATQENTVADHPEEVLMNANTPVVTPAVMYGDCWRATYTMGAAGTGVFSIIGADK